MSIQVKERPILFSAPMVRAILKGRKTQTRRVVKPHPRLGLLGNGQPIGNGQLVWEPKKGRVIPITENCIFQVFDYSPYGEEGNRLWVRETFYEGVEKIWYRADIGDPTKCGISCWKPSIFMPRKYSRITLEITDIRFEQLHDISEEDAIAEGVDRTEHGWKCYGDCPEHKTGRIHRTSATASFMSLWDSINGATYPWDGNPWVWVISFKQIEKD